MTEQFSLYQPLQVVSKWCGQNIFAPLERKKCEKLYIIFFLFALIAIYIFVLAWRHSLPSNWSTNLYNLTYLSLFVSNLLSLYYVNFSRRIDLCVLFTNINILYIDIADQFPGLVAKEERQFQNNFIAYHILCLFFSIFQCIHTFVSMSFPLYYDIIPITIFNYLVMLTVLQYSCVVFVIKNLFDVLNKEVYGFKMAKLNFHHVRNQIKTTSDVQCLLKSYDRVFKIAGDINRIFGVPLIGVYIVLLVSIIRCVAMCVRFGIFNPGNEIFSLTNIFGCLMWLGLAHLVSAACAGARYALREGSIMLYEVIINIPSYQKYGGNGLLRDDFLLLEYSLLNRPFTFTACGFYEIDYSLMFAMMGSIAYYVVILIQLD